MLSRIKLILLSTFVALPVIALGCYSMLMRDFTRSGSMLIHNGTVITMEPDQSTVDAVFVEAGRIVAVGPYDELVKQLEGDTVVIDLKGKTLLPGFIDSHTHPLISTFTYGMVDLSGFTHRTDAEVWQHLKEQVKTFKPGGMTP